MCNTTADPLFYILKGIHFAAAPVASRTSEFQLLLLYFSWVSLNVFASAQSCIYQLLYQLIDVLHVA